MAFVKGKSGNPKGKPKGIPSATTKDARQVFISIMEGEVENVQFALEEIRSKSAFNYIVCLSKLMPYFMPKQIDIKSDGEKMPIPIIQLLPHSEK